MIKVLLYIWQLPQNLLGLILLLLYRIKGDLAKQLSIGNLPVYFSKYMPSGISLGEYIILETPKSLIPKINDVLHEYGHTKQSRILGPFYLLIIGIPSLIGNIYDRVRHSNWTNKARNLWYYNQPWEKWADKLGGVKR